MDGAEDLVEAEAVLHRRDIFGQHVAGVLADDGGAQNLVAADRRNHLHEAMCLAVGDGAVEIIQAVNKHLVRDALFLRFLLVDADPRHFRLGEGSPGDHRVIDLEFLELSEQRVHCRVPGHMRRRVRELVRPGDVAAGKDVRVNRFQIIIHFHGFLCGDAEFFKAVAGGIGDAADRAQDFIKCDADVAAFVFHHQILLAILYNYLLGLVVDQHLDALGLKFLFHHLGNLDILANHDARRHLHLRYLAAEAREALRQLAADRPATQHHQALGQLADAPQVVRVQRVHLGEARNRRDERTRAGGDHDVPGRQRLLAIGGGDFHRPRRGDLCRAGHAIHAEPGKALDRVMRLDFTNNALHAFHHLGEVELGFSLANAEFIGALHMREQLGRADQCLRGHAAGIQAIAAHFVFFHERYFGLHRRGDVGGDKTCRTAADHHHIAIKVRGLRPFRIDLACLQTVDDFLGDDREDAEQHKGADQAWREDAFQ